MAPPPKLRNLTSASDASSDTDSAAASPLDGLLDAALAMADPAVPIGLSLNRIVSSTPLWIDRERLFDRAMRFSAALADAVVRARNPHGWPLPADLTVKVLSMLDTRSVCVAAATSELFWKCSSDPLCYANIDMTRSKTNVTNRVVSNMIQRAGTKLQSIKIGTLHEDNSLLSFLELSLLGSCLAPLAWNGGATGSLLRQLHLYDVHIEVQARGFCSALSACQSLVDLKIVGIDFRLDNILRTIREHCHLIECLHLEVHADKYWRIFNSEASELEILIENCPLLSSLTIRGIGIEDDLLSVLLKGAHGLKSLDLSGSHTFSGDFLSDLGNGSAANSLETLILRECDRLKADAVSVFLWDVLRGDWKGLRYVDISNSQGLVLRHNWTECERCSIEVSPVLQGRPDVHLIADYPPEIYFYDCMSPPSPRSRRAAYSAWLDSIFKKNVAASCAQSWSIRGRR